ncbi:glutaminyl-peptide cyclotransferase [Hoyosella sp. G463]|uniref:Glutaminyl-peptide cyclotransferase n=1 Tax=Lolliginicoccus lacisalsi TaxID=2742202 RepID=A0A927PKA9_9ACTN|nr:glutaminyl-peptide cyclotransferase [Lolliginicoccus lacisalsi]MBD8505820.1 glutaminyl-peptide cyclotransferase [Lolliginicoccus lacisalsi]
MHAIAPPARPLVAAALLVPLLGAGCVEPRVPGTGSQSPSTTSLEPVTPGPEDATLTVAVVERHPHGRDSFTQGLELSDGVLYESTGLVGSSWIEARTFPGGEVLARADLTDPFFGEGLTVTEEIAWQVTWQDGVAIARDPATLEERSRTTYEGEGWGLCSYDDDAERGAHLVMSDGTSTLTVRDPATFDARETIPVTLDGAPVELLNELECTPDGVYANVWTTDMIVRIDPRTGAIEDVIDASGLLSRAERQGADVLNGIAAIPGTDRFLITGKLWPVMLEARFVPR